MENKTPQRDSRGRFVDGHCVRAYSAEEKNYIVEMLCDKLTEGIALYKAIAILIHQKEIPATFSFDTFYRWIKGSLSISDDVSQARTEGYLKRLEEIYELDRLAIQEVLNPSIVAPKIANAYANLHKTKINNLKWLAERFHPQQFSQRLQVHSRVGHPVVEINIIIPSK